MHFIGLALRIVGITIGAALTVIGVPLLLSPIPLGLVLIALGTVFLVASSTHAHRWVRRRRERHPKFDARLRRIEDGMPALFRGLLTSTRPSDAN
mgnify:CR=1 FL=1